MSRDRDTDPFRPPEIPVEVQCLHCGEEYDSWRIEWREEMCHDGEVRGFWCCPMPGCDGRGFGFDLLPTDPEYQDEHGGWVSFDDEDEEDEADGLESFYGGADDGGGLMDDPADPGGFRFPPGDWTADPDDDGLPF